MAEIQFLLVVFTIIVPGAMSSDSSFSFCPALCSCEHKRINCEMNSLPVKLPPEIFDILDIRSPRKSYVGAIPPRAFHLSKENKNLVVKFFDLEISTISANAFEGLEEVDKIIIHSCRIENLETYSFSNVNVSNRIYVSNSSIGTIHRFAFHQINTAKFYIYRTNITRISTAAFARTNIASFYLFKSNVEFIESNAIGHWTNGINTVKLMYNNIGIFECNEPNNDTSVSITNISVNCTCDLIWILKNTSSFYPFRSKFQCHGNSGSSLLEMEDSLQIFCINQTQTIDDSCSSKELFNNNFINDGLIESKSARQIISVSLLLINCLIMFM